VSALALPLLAVASDISIAVNASVLAVMSSNPRQSAPDPWCRGVADSDLSPSDKRDDCLQQAPLRVANTTEM